MSNLKKSVTVPLLLDNDGKDDLPVLPCPSTSSIGQAKCCTKALSFATFIGVYLLITL